MPISHTDLCDFISGISSCIYNYPYFPGSSEEVVTAVLVISYSRVRMVGCSYSKKGKERKGKKERGKA